jgi:hypothetical protein
MSIGQAEVPVRLTQYLMLQAEFTATISANSGGRGFVVCSFT